MGSGGKFRDTPVPIGDVVSIYAGIGNLKDAVDKTEKLIDHIGQHPDDPSAWEGLELYRERIKSRSMTLGMLIGNLLKGQKQ